MLRRIGDFRRQRCDYSPRCCGLPALLAAASGTQRPLLNTLKGQPTERTEPIFWAHAGWGAIRHGRWKAVRAPGSNAWQLYDLENDPQEDQPAADADRLTTMKAQWQRWVRTVGADPNFDPRAFYRSMMQR